MTTMQTVRHTTTVLTPNVDTRSSRSAANRYLTEMPPTLDTMIEDQAEEAKKEAPTAALETVYFRTFRTRPLLDREHELQLAQEIDESSQCIRAALSQAIQLMKHLANKPHFQASIGSLTATRELSGFSAPSLDEAMRRGVHRAFAPTHARRFLQVLDRATSVRH